MNNSYLGRLPLLIDVLFIIQLVFYVDYISDLTKCEYSKIVYIIDQSYNITVNVNILT